MVRGKLEEAAVEAVARPVGSDGEAVSAVGRRLEVAGGEEIARRLQRMGELPVGGAVLTPAGDLPARFVVHMVVRSPEEQVTHLTVRRALLNTLGRAHDWDVASLALPPLGLGAGNLDAEAAADLVVGLVRDHQEGGRSPGEVVIVVESEFEEGLFRRAVRTGSHGGSGSPRGAEAPA